MSGKTNIVDGAVNGGNKASANTGKTNTDLMASQAVYEGTVIASDSELRTLTVDTGAAVLTGCEYLPGVMAGLLGVSISSLPPVGTRVVVLRGRAQSYVISAQQATGAKVPDTLGIVAGVKDTDAWEEEAFQTSRESTGKAQGHGMHEAVDLYQGELDLTNSMGVALRALHNFAALSAGDAAKVETHLFNAMVRIVSGYFVHHSVGGDTMIWSNGGCNKEEHFTSYQFEADGKPDPTSGYATPGSYANTFDPEKSCEDPVNDTGRWRLSRYTGFMGDLIHTFVSTPTDMITTYNQNATRDGQFRASVGADGTLAIQAHGGVFVQVTPRVQIPTIFHKWDDPEFDAEEAFKNLNKEYLRLWDKGADWKNLEYACWQMRSYLRYIIQYHSLQRFLQLQEKGLCKVPIDSSTAGHSCAAEDDKKAVNGSDTSYPWLREASISIDPSGSITLESNQSASVILNQGNVQIAAAGNIELKAGGTVSIQGRDMSILSASDMEIVSMAGNIAMKARTVLKMLCEKGRIWLKSDAREFSPEDTTIADEVESTGEMNKYAIVLDAPQGSTLISAKEQLALGTETGDLYISALKGVLYMYGREFKMFAQVKVLIKSIAVALAGKLAGIKASVLQLTESCQIVNGGGIVTDKKVTCDGVISSGAVVSPGWQKHVAPGGGSPPDPKSAAMDYVSEADELTKDAVYSDYQSEELDNDVFSLRKWTDVVTTTKEHTESLKASPVDDYCINAGMPLMTPVPETYTKLASAKRTEASKVWPGEQRDSALLVWQDSSIPPLDKPLGTEYPGPSGEGALTPQKYVYMVRQPKQENPSPSDGR